MLMLLKGYQVSVITNSGLPQVVLSYHLAIILKKTINHLMEELILLLHLATKQLFL
jgi:hypothetical protein